MEDPVTDLQALGAETARALEAFAVERAAALDTARWNFLQASAPARPRRTLQIALAFAALALTVLALTSVLRTKPLLSFQVDARVGRTNDQISALARPVTLAFSDGTAIMLAASTRAHVVSLAEHGANLALESGSLDARVVHTGVSGWVFSAGPFSVRITGTKFLLSWDPSKQHFSIRVTEGGVAVSGSVVGADCPVRAGQTLIVSVPEHRMQLSNDDQLPNQAAADSALAPTPEPPTPPSAAPTSVQDLQPPSPRTVVPSAPSAPSWRTLAQQGRLREAYVSADESGFERACDSATAAELLLLGDAARLSGRADRVNVALLQLRRRFPRDPRSAVAAFMLGKVSFDRGGSDRAAAIWFATSLREQPRGSLAREAAGRLVEALQRAGDSAGARRAAKDYLSSYPDGPHAALARSLLH